MPTGRTEEIFKSALERPAAERKAYVAQACGDDAVLMAEVQALLTAHEGSREFLETVLGTHEPFSAVIADQLARLKPEKAGEMIGPYKLRERIGEGGFGTVWVADQEKPVRRRVALKIIKLGMDTKEVIARFEQERQALAMMDHPNIAKVLDAGATEHGRPFFAMELVRGVKITDYCDEQQLSTQERIELFITVCEAVQHAHQKGIIHRDLKPSNILVTINDGKAVPKVIDFGVAKATQGRLTDQTVYTQFQQMIGTPLYMSPEQAELTSLDIDTRSDIYSLGVLLYELLTGHTPIDRKTMARVGMDEMRRLIREVDPQRPSMRVKTLDGAELTTTAKRRHTDPARLPGTLRGDIDWIVMKCLEKDRQRRYDTANGLALDLRRHLANEVVVARPPTTAYLLSKLIRRNKAAFAAGAAVVAALVIGIAASLWQAVRATRAERSAVAAFDELRATAPAFAEQARGLAAKEHFDEAITKLDYAVKLRPDAPEYLVAKGDLLQCQLKLADAAVIYREALRVKPSLARAEASAKLCDELLAAPTSEQGKLTRESLAKLHLTMQKQQRPAAELMPVARLLGEEKKLIVEYWLARLKDLPVSAEKPLKERLTVRDDGRLALDLSDTKITDLAPLASAPLAMLNVSGSTELSNLAPLRGMDLVELDIGNTSVADLTPLREMHTLEKLEISASKVTDLSELRALRLKSLSFQSCPISDLTPIQKMPLEYISLRETRVADLSPLIGMPIKSIDISSGPVLDFSPLAQLPLEKCYLQLCQISDLSVLRGKPLKELVIADCSLARNYAVLAEFKTLELLLLPTTYRDLPAEDYAAIGALRSLPKLRQIASEGMGGMRFASTGSKDVFWQDWDREQTFVPALRASGNKFSLTKLPTGSYSLQIIRQPLRDLSILKGAPISRLTISSCQIEDLTPLHDLPIEYLNIPGNPITDVSPLQGTQIKTLFLSGTKVSDLSPLTSLPLNELYLVGCENVTDVAVLAEIPTLEKVVVPVHSKNIEALRKLTRLQRLAFQHTDSFPWIPITTAEEFWQQWPGMTWARALNEAGMKYTAKQDAEGKWSITVTSKNFSDCSIFKGAAIRELTLTGTAVSDLSPLHGMTMKKLWLGGTKVTDLEPLRGMALRELTLSGTKVTDLRPIEGMPLDWLHLRGTAVKDLSVLRGMPLVNLWLDGCTELTDLSPLAEAKKLNKLFLPPNPKSIEFLRAMPGLEWIDFTENANKDKTAAEFWKEYDTQSWLKTLRDSGVAIKPAKQLPDGTWEVDLRDTKLSDLTMLKGAPISSLSLDNTDVSDLSPLRGMALKTLGLNHTKVTDLSPLQGLPLEELSLYGTRVTNISVLRGVPLKTLDLSGTSVTDLEPLRGMALKKLWLHNTKVAELRPLEQMPLELLYLAGTKVTDLSALRGMPLTLLKLHDCSELTDLSPLAEAKNLTDLSLPLNAKNLEFLRAFPKLERIDFKSDPKSGYKSAADFWKEYDTQGWLRTLRESGAKISALNQLPDGTWDLRIRDAEFSDLTLLRGARISSLEIYGTAVADLTPLRGMPIKKLWIAGTKVSDISALADLPLESLTLHGTAVPHLSPLLKCPTLKSITLPANARNVSVLRALTALERISYSLDSHTNPAQTAAEFWKDYERQAWATALRASGAKISVLKLLPDGTWEVDIPDPKFSDLSLLSGAPISSLRVGQSGVTDLTPLRGMAIKKLYIHTTNVTDLSPLQGMQLELLNVARTKITDFSAVRGMPLKHICLDSTSVADLRAFEELPLTTLRLNACVALSDLSLLTKFKELTNLTLPPNAKDIGFLRDLPKLERISFTDDPKNGYRPDKTAAEFWKEYDAKKK